MPKLDSSVERVLVALVRGLRALNVRFCVVGALAPELLLNEAPPQATLDADAVVFVPDLETFDRIKRRLVGFQPDPGRPGRLRHEDGGRADILPYSEQLAPDGILRLEPHYVFNVAGFDRLASATVDVMLEGRDAVPVVGIPLYVLLKLVAFTDRGRQKDIDGVLHCLRSYADDDDRRYGLQHQGAAVPYEYGSAYLLGTDARPFLNDRLTKAIGPLLERLVPSDVDIDDDQLYREREDRQYLRWFRAGLGI